MKALRSPRIRGFTLIEIMVVITILGILAALIVPRVVGRTDDARIAAAYQYLNPGLRGEIDVFSFGADGQAGGQNTDADIGSWSL
jgi:prepilin-type N-terminal cleavage/methylation domain-containing protein